MFNQQTPYRCRECWNRFFKRTELPSKKSKTFKIAAGVILIIILILLYPVLFRKPKTIPPSKMKSITQTHLKQSTDEKPAGDVEKPKSITPDKPVASTPKTVENEQTVEIPSPVEPTAEEPKEDLMAKLLKEDPETKPVNPPTTVEEKEPEPAIEKDAEETGIKPTAMDDKPKPEMESGNDTPSVESNAETGPPDAGAGMETMADETTASEPKLFKGVDASDIDGTLRIRIKTEVPVTDYDFFYWPGETSARFGIDIKGNWKHYGDSVFRIKSDIADKVRVGNHTDKQFMRVVVDLKSTRPIIYETREIAEGLILSITPKKETSE